MTVYKPNEVNIQELLQRQHEKYGKKMMRCYEYISARNKALSEGRSVKNANRQARKAVKIFDKRKNI